MPLLAVVLAVLLLVVLVAVVVVDFVVAVDDGFVVYIDLCFLRCSISLMEMLQLHLNLLLFYFRTVSPIVSLMKLTTAATVIAVAGVYFLSTHDLLPETWTPNTVVLKKMILIHFGPTR